MRRYYNSKNTHDRLERKERRYQKEQETSATINRIRYSFTDGMIDRSLLSTYLEEEEQKKITTGT